MKILQFCFRVPYPLKDGGAIAMFNLTKGLSPLVEQLDVFAYNTKKHYQDIKKLPSEFTQKTKIYTVNLNTDINYLDAFINLFTRKSYNVERFVDKNVKKELKNLLVKNQYDIIQLEGLYVTAYIDTIKKYSDAKIVLRSHNIEYKIWERLKSKMKFGLRKSYISLLSKRLKHYETSQFENYDLITAMSIEDAKHFLELGCKTPVIIVPIGIDLEKYQSYDNLPVTNGCMANSIFHIGAMDWMPNIQAIKWFLDCVWPQLRCKHPDVSLYIAGRNTPKWLSKINIPNIDVVGEVEDALDFMKSKNIMIVPLLSGSGIRVKILEGMAIGKTIISTSIGAEGIDCKHNHNIMIADNKNEFALCISKCLENSTFCKQLGNNARKLIHEKYNINQISKELVKSYKTLLE